MTTDLKIYRRTNWTGNALGCTVYFVEMDDLFFWLRLKAGEKTQLSVKSSNTTWTNCDDDGVIMKVIANLIDNNDYLVQDTTETPEGW